MRYLLATGLLYLSGCAFWDWGTTDPNGGAPLENAAKDVLTDSLTGLETGGIAAGILALAFTSLKTGLRLYHGWQASKAKPPTA
jgi:hypothetical protein